MRTFLPIVVMLLVVAVSQSDQIQQLVQNNTELTIVDGVAMTSSNQQTGSRATDDWRLNPVADCDPTGTTTGVPVDCSSNGTPTQAPPGIAAQATKFIIYDIGISIHRYYLPVIVILGFAGNTLTFLVMSMRHNRRLSCCVYMATLAISDQIMLFIGGYYLVVSEFSTIHPLECTLITYMFQIFSQNGIFLVVLMTIDRFIAIRFPLKASRLCTPKRAKLSMIVLLALLAIYNIPYLYATKVIGSNCIAFQTKTTLIQLYSWCSIVLNAVVPFILILACNSQIISSLYKRRLFRRSQAEQVEGGKHNHDPQKQPGKTTDVASVSSVSINVDSTTTQDTSVSVSTKELSIKKNSKTGSAGMKENEAQLTAMLLAVTFTLLLLTLPQYTRYAIYVVVDYTTTAIDYATFILAYHITNKLYFTNNAVNFLLYAVSGTKFRRDLVTLFSRRKSKMAATSMMTSTSTFNTQ